jgi:4-carboxymuconolactone decarboxylase
VSEDKAAKGMEVLRKLFGENVSEPAFPDDLRRYTVEHLFGDVWQGSDLTIEERSLITCTVLVALGREAEQRIHFRGARNLGIPRKKLEAVLTHIAHYAGWPVAVSANRNLNEVWPAD